MNEGVPHRMIRAGSLQPGDVLFWNTKPLRTVEEVMLDTLVSQYPPHREYRGIKARFKGETEFTYQRGASSWIGIVDQRQQPFDDRFSAPTNHYDRTY